MANYDNSLEKLYLPSRWSQRFPPDLIVEKHTTLACQESEKARRLIPHELNIPYGPLHKEKIDIFGTDLSDDAPLFVFVHGGYWQEQTLTRDTYHFIATNLHKRGAKSMFIGYELCPSVPLTKIIEEAEVATKKCIDYARKHKSKGVYLTGYSAGSHLVASLYTDLVKELSCEDRGVVTAAILIAGIYDLHEIPKTSVNAPLKLDAEEADKLSPYRRDIAGGVKTSFYVVSAENDSPEFGKQSREFHEKLVGLGVKSTLVVCEDVDHFDVVERLKDEDFHLTKLILDLVKQ